MKEQSKVLCAEIFHRVKNEKEFSSRIPTSFVFSYSETVGGLKDFKRRSSKMPNLPIDLQDPDSRPKAIRFLHASACKLIDEVWQGDTIFPKVTNIGICVTTFKPISKNRLTKYFVHKRKQ